MLFWHFLIKPCFNFGNLIKEKLKINNWCGFFIEVFDVWVSNIYSKKINEFRIIFFKNQYMKEKKYIIVFFKDLFNSYFP